MPRTMSNPASAVPSSPSLQREIDGATRAVADAEGVLAHSRKRLKQVEALPQVSSGCVCVCVDAALRPLSKWPPSPPQQPKIPEDEASEDDARRAELQAGIDEAEAAVQVQGAAVQAAMQEAQGKARLVEEAQAALAAAEAQETDEASPVQVAMAALEKATALQKVKGFYDPPFLCLLQRSAVLHLSVPPSTDRRGAAGEDPRCHRQVQAEDGRDSGQVRRVEGGAGANTSGAGAHEVYDSLGSSCLSTSFLLPRPVPAGTTRGEGLAGARRHGHGGAQGGRRAPDAQACRGCRATPPGRARRGAQEAPRCRHRQGVLLRGSAEGGAGAKGRVHSSSSVCSLCR